MDRSLFLYLIIAAVFVTPIFLLIPTDLSPDIILVLFLLSSFAPLIAAILALFFSDNSIGVHTFFRRLFLWRSERFWYAMALLVPAGVWLIALAHFPFGGGLQAATPLSILYFPLVLIATYGSEAGLRGFVLPRLLAFLDPIPSSLLLAGLWSALYAPFFWHEPLTMALIIAIGPILSITSTWLFLGTGESVPLSALFQTTFITFGLVISPVPNSALVLATALAGLWALFLVMRCGGCLLNIQADEQTSNAAPSTALQYWEQYERPDSNGHEMYGKLAVKQPVNLIKNP